MKISIYLYYFVAGLWIATGIGSLIVGCSVTECSDVPPLAFHWFLALSPVVFILGTNKEHLTK